MRPRADLFATAIVASLLSGCGGGDRTDAPVGDNATVVPAPLPTIPPSPTPVPSASPVVSSVPPAISVLTAEPFYHAEISGNGIVLTGVTTPRREMAILDREVTADGRGWRARDDRGDLIVRVERRSCSDGMSDKRHELTATLVFDGQTVRGCGYAGKAPAPAPAPAAATVAIPARFVGTWNVDRAACATPATSIEGLKITPAELVFHESAGTVTVVRPTKSEGVRITADYEGEGERWTMTQTLTIDGDRLIVDTGGRRVSRVRCPE